MEFLETYLLTVPLFHSIKYWRRYVDDVVEIFPNEFPTDNFLNTLEPLIQFTFESPPNHSIPYLDLLISFNHICNQIAIYRKPTHAGVFYTVFLITLPISKIESSAISHEPIKFLPIKLQPERIHSPFLSSTWFPHLLIQNK